MPLLRLLSTPTLWSSQVGCCTTRSRLAPAHILIVHLPGLHLLESRPESVRSARLRALAAELAELRARSLPPLIHVELASVADPSYMGVIADALFPSVDSIGEPGS